MLLGLGIFFPMLRSAALRRLRLFSNHIGHSALTPRKSSQRALSRAYSSTADEHQKPGPLAGIKVLDLSRVLAAPFCTQILADYGADVIKVEQPGTGDETRNWKAPGEAAKWRSGAEPMSYYFTAINRNKRSITLNLKKPEAIGILKKLAKTSDVLIENFVPGKADELGIGYSTMSKINPRIIYASISGYGSTGPYAKKAGYDAIAAAEAGLMHISGHPDGPPVRPGVGMVDMATGLYMHGAIMAALHSRIHTGRGQHISASLFETQVSLLINIGTNWLNLGLEGKRFGNAHPSICPYGTYEAKDAWMAIGANNDRQFRVLCERLGRMDLFEDPRYKTNPQRVEQRETLDAEISSVIREKTVESWMELLEGSGLAYGPVNTIERAFAHPQIQAREMVQTVHHSALKDGELLGIGPPVKFSGSRPRIKHGAPLLGQNTHEVLREIGYSEEDIKHFKDAQIT